MRFAIVLTLASLMPSLERTPDTPQSRWPGAASNHAPLWSGAACPGSYSAWKYDRRRNPVCVQNI